MQSLAKSVIILSNIQRDYGNNKLIIYKLQAKSHVKWQILCMIILNFWPITSNKYQGILF